MTESIVQLAEITLQFIRETHGPGLVGLGIIGLFYVTVSLLMTVEQAMNEIWGVRHGRDLGRLIRDYFFLIILAPLLLMIGLSVSTMLTVIRVPDSIPLAFMIDDVVFAPILAVLPFVAIWGGFIFICYYMPNRRVYWLSAVIGGLIGGSLWHLAQWGYIHLTLSLIANRYNAIYKSFAWVFILVIWINISWAILLFAAEISAAHQLLEDRRRRRRPWRDTPAERETLTLRVAALLARPMIAPVSQPFRPMTLLTLADELHVPPEPIERTLELFHGAQLVRRDGDESPDRSHAYLRNRAPQTVGVTDLLRLVRHGSFDAQAPLAVETADGALAPAGTEAAARLSALTLADLIATPLDRIRTFSLSPPRS
jgi:membrane protein